MGIFKCLLIVWQIGNVICDIINSCNMKIVLKKINNTHHEALASERQTNALFKQANGSVENAKKFSVLLFSSEGKAHALSVIVRKYNFKGPVKVTKGLLKDEQRILKKVSKRLLLPLKG